MVEEQKSREHAKINTTWASQHYQAGVTLCFWSACGVNGSLQFTETELELSSNRLIINRLDVKLAHAWTNICHFYVLMTTECGVLALPIHSDSSLVLLVWNKLPGELSRCLFSDETCLKLLQRHMTLQLIYQNVLGVVQTQRISDNSESKHHCLQASEMPNKLCPSC